MASTDLWGRSACGPAVSPEGCCAEELRDLLEQVGFAEGRSSPAAMSSPARRCTRTQPLIERSRLRDDDGGPRRTGAAIGERAGQTALS
jgi:hypothetical protein